MTVQDHCGEPKHLIDMTYRQLEKKIAADLEKSGIENAQVEAVNLIVEISGLTQGSYLMKKMCEVDPSEDELERLNTAAKRRCAREPLQYITGKAYFRDLELSVNPDVLIPRFETEILVDEVLKNAPYGASVLDIGTGSGAIAVSCANERHDLNVTAADISPQALKTAENNARKYNCRNIEFKLSDLFSDISSSFDVIAANLPYVTNQEYCALQQEVKDHEPRLALTAERDGLELIFKTCDDLSEHLNDRGFAIFEMSPDQTGIVKACLENLGFSAYIIEDYTHRPRFVCARKK